MATLDGDSQALEALAAAKPAVFWTDRDVPFAGESVVGDVSRADLAIIGGGFTGLWSAILAVERDPGRSVVVLEAGTVGVGASGRNGGFVADSICHGLAHGAVTWPDELPLLLRLGRENMDQLEVFLDAEGIDAGFRRCGKTTVAIADHHVTHLRELAELFAEHGEAAELLDGPMVRADVDSPTYLAGLRIHSGYGLVDPARLAWGLAQAARARGVRIIEDARVADIEHAGGRITLAVGEARLEADRVVVATNAFPSPLRRLRRFVVPFYDYVLMTEPLNDAQWASLGWSERQGVTDAGNFFHYYRPTDDGRILWGGYDAVYRYGSRVHPSLDQHEASHRTLAGHFFETFPQLEGLRFSHRWGGAIDSTSRFTPVFGTAMGGRVAYAVGYTGLGVAAARFGAAVALDLLDGSDTDRVGLSMVRKKPLPFPPEPLRWLAVRITQAELARQDRNDGRASLWLRLLDRFGVGFTS